MALILPIRSKISLKLPEIFQPIFSQSADTVTSGVAMVADTVTTWEWYQYAELLWMVGVFGFLSWHLIQHLRFLFAIKRWSEEVKEFEVLEQFNLTKAQLKIRKHIAIKSCACINTPMMIGLIHPVVLLPQVDFLQDELSLILKHELVHYKRKDLWYKMIMMMVLAIHWFNPVVHLMVRSVLTLCEISCDETVLKGIDAKRRAKYGEAIIAIVRNGSTYKTALSSNFYSGINGMKKRIYAMMDMTNKRFSPVLFMAVFMLTLCGTTAFALLPVHAEKMVLDFNKTVTAAIEPNQTNTESISMQTSSNPDMEQNNQVKSSSNDNEELDGCENMLLPDDEYSPEEPPQSYPYDSDEFQLIAIDEW